MPNKYCFGLTRAEKLRILAKNQAVYNLLTEMDA